MGEAGLAMSVERPTPYEERLRLALQMAYAEFCELEQYAGTTNVARHILRGLAFCKWDKQPEWDERMAAVEEEMAQSAWNHSLCRSCYEVEEPGRAPVSVLELHVCCDDGSVQCTCHDESAWSPGTYPDGCSACGCRRVSQACCRCGKPTTDGIYYRKHPATYRCAGSHS